MGALWGREKGDTESSESESCDTLAIQLAVMEDTLCALRAERDRLAERKRTHNRRAWIVAVVMLAATFAFYLMGTAVDEYGQRPSVSDQMAYAAPLLVLPLLCHIARIALLSANSKALGEANRALGVAGETFTAILARLELKRAAMASANSPSGHPRRRRAAGQASPDHGMVPSSEQSRTKAPRRRRGVFAALCALLSPSEPKLYALMCAQCGAKNGHVPQQEAAEAQFTCTGCGFFNDRRLLAQSRARLERRRRRSDTEESMEGMSYASPCGDGGGSSDGAVGESEYSERQVSYEDSFIDDDEEEYESRLGDDFDHEEEEEEEDDEEDDEEDEGDEDVDEDDWEDLIDEPNHQSRKSSLGVGGIASRLKWKKPQGVVQPRVQFLVVDGGEDGEDA